MSCDRTYERYDEDEYFMRFFRIHPYLSYVNEDDEINQLKLSIQRRLIELSNDKNIDFSQDKCIEKYSKLVNIQTDNKCFLAKTEAEMKKLLKSIKNEMNNNTIDRFKNILNNINSQ